MSTVFDTLLRPAILRAAASTRIKETSQRMPVTQRVVERFVPGETLDDVIIAIRAELDRGTLVTIDYLGEDTLDEAQATATVEAYLALLGAMKDIDRTGLAPGCLEVSLKLTALGQLLPEHGAKIAEENAHTICAAARDAGVLVTIDAEDHTTVDERLAIVRRLRVEFPDLGTVLQAYLRRTEDDCTDFSDARIRLCKGAYAEPPTVAYVDRDQIDEAYQRCLRILMKGAGYPMWPVTTRRSSVPHRAWPPSSTARPTPGNTRCSTASAPTSNSASPTPEHACVCTSPTARSGTATSSGASPRSPRT